MVSAALRMPLRVVLLVASTFSSAVIHEGTLRRRAASCALVMPKASCSARSQPRAGGFLVQSCHDLSNPSATMDCHGADGHEVRPLAGAGDGPCRAFGHSAANLQMFTRSDRLDPELAPWPGRDRAVRWPRAPYARRQDPSVQDAPALVLELFERLANEFEHGVDVQAGTGVETHSDALAVDRA